MRLFAPVCSQTTSLQRCCSNFCFGQRSSRSPTRSKSTACKGCCGISAPSEQWVRLLQPLLPHSKERWRAKTYSRSQMSEPLTYAPVILLTIKQFLVHICSEDWFLTQKLTFVAQSLRAPGVGHQLAQESLVAQTAGCLSGNDFRLCPNAGMDYAGTIPDNPAIGGISQTGDDPPPEGFPEVTRLHGSHRLCNTSGPASHAAPSNLAQCPSSIPRLASGTVSYQDRPPLCQSCGPLDDLSLVSDRNEVRADLQEEGSHNRRIQLGLGRPVGGQSASGSWSVLEQCLHINCLKMLAVFWALKSFLPALKGRHVSVRSDHITVVSYINRQDGLRSRSLYRMARRLLFWAQKELLS